LAASKQHVQKRKCSVMQWSGTKEKLGGPWACEGRWTAVDELCFFCFVGGFENEFRR
jgi:hypothetical protein